MSAPTLVPPKTLSPPKTKSQALRSFDVTDFPDLNGREEEWRFTPLKQLRGLDKSAGGEGGKLEREYGLLPAGVTVSTVDRSDKRVGSALTPFDRISALAFGQTESATVVSVAREAVVAEPVVIRVGGTGNLRGMPRCRVPRESSCKLIVANNDNYALAA